MYTEATGSRAEVFHGGAHAHRRWSRYQEVISFRTKDGVLYPRVRRRRCGQEVVSSRRVRPLWFMAFIDLAKERADFKLAPKKGTKTYKTLIKII